MTNVHAKITLKNRTERANKLRAENIDQYKSDRNITYDANDYVVLRRDVADHDFTLHSKTGQEAEIIPPTPIAEKIKEKIEDKIDTVKNVIKQKEEDVKELVSDMKNIQKNTAASVQNALANTEDYLKNKDIQARQNPEKKGREKIIDSNASDLPVAKHKVVEEKLSKGMSVLDHLKQEDQRVFNLKKVNGKIQVNEDKNANPKESKHGSHVMDNLQDIKKKTRDMLESYAIYPIRSKIKDFFITRTHAVNTCLLDIYDWAHLYSMHHSLYEVEANKVPAALRERMDRALIKCNQKFNHKCFYQNADEAINHVIKNFKDKKKCPQIDENGMEHDGILIIKE